MRNNWSSQSFTKLTLGFVTAKHHPGGEGEEGHQLDANLQMLNMYFTFLKKME